MGLAITRVKVYFRLTLLLIVLIAIAILLFKNRNHEVNVWFFGLTDENKPVNVVWLMFLTSFMSLFCWWVISKVWLLYRDMKKLAVADDMKQREHDLKEQEASLAEKEKTITQKNENETDE